MPNINNLLLDSLSAADAASIRPFLKPAHLKLKQVLFEAEDLVPAVYFPTGAVVSLVIALGSGATIEAAMVGRDGVVGASSALDGKISLSRAVVQLEGTSLTCEPGALKGTALQSHTFLSKLIRHEQTFKPNSPLPAWQNITSKSGSAVGFCGRETYPVVTSCVSLRNL
jgi:hypothetical protein